MKKVLRNKLHKERGFSLAELLVAILILAMVSATVAGGVPVARNAYNKVVIAANAEVLLSTAVTTLRNELGTAEIVDPSDSFEHESITYFKRDTGSFSEISTDITVGSENSVSGSSVSKGITLRELIGVDDDGKPSTEGGQERNLVSKKAGTDDLRITYGTVKYEKDKGIVTFSNIIVVKTKGSGLEASPRAKLDKLEIRVITAQTVFDGS